MGPRELPRVLTWRAYARSVSARRTSSRPTPTLSAERELFARGHSAVVGVDEVGRGALAGPVAVGAVLLVSSTSEPPENLRDSKLMSPPARDEMEPRVREWATASAVGFATPQEIDTFGILVALRLAGERALRDLGRSFDVVILDGSYNWLQRPQRPLVADGTRCDVDVIVRTKADRDCASVAAASVVAKVARDRLMTVLDASHPHYGWNSNKGYAAEQHVQAIVDHGACEHHRRSWNLTGSRG